MRIYIWGTIRLNLSKVAAEKVKSPDGTRLYIYTRLRIPTYTGHIDLGFLIGLYCIPLYLYDFYSARELNGRRLTRPLALTLQLAPPRTIVAAAVSSIIFVNRVH